jgi:hypothetical protein
MFRISCFADELSPDIHEQIDFLEKNRIKYVDLRSMWHKRTVGKPGHRCVKYWLTNRKGRYSY